MKDQPLNLTPIQALGVALSVMPDSEIRTMQECIDMAPKMQSHLRRMGFEVHKIVAEPV